MGKSQKKGWLFYLGWIFAIIPNMFSFEYWLVSHRNGWVTDCYAIDYWSIFFGFVALGLALLHFKDWRIWSYGLGAAAIAAIGIGFNVGGVLCPEYVDPRSGVSFGGLFP